ncbi:four helix bundle protein [Sporosarcina sp. BI001-red]|uniref:four helix bundle protein n=1 Tax=Sporosarcina sp. BI001-red TaxID=2282866 RepID=UPI000E259134|nr:four helix bundle protein [Sporosarcina sp. BI001-red]REB11000.1 four helix bundle protein [Sporosarcina sp. BI001-red]
MKDPKTLEVSKRIRVFVHKCYEVTNKFPSLEKFELSSQLRRASSSIYLNLSEGNPSIYKKTYIKHLDSSICSGHEVRAIFDLILDLEYITLEEHEQLENEMKEIQYILTAIINKARREVVSGIV